MAFFDIKYKKELEFLEDNFKKLTTLEKFAAQKGIKDIFQDNGAKVLQQLVISGMTNLPGREGNDAIDSNGVEWEFKSINIATKASGFSTDHHATEKLLNRFNSIPWLFSIYNNVQLLEMYVLSPGQLNEWTEQKIKHLRDRGVPSLNNPKIPLKYVKTNGVRIYPFPDPPIDPATLDGSQCFEDNKNNSN